MSVIFATCRYKPALTASDDLIAAHLRSQGITVTAAPWDSLAPAKLGDATVCLRSTWDYHTRAADFRAWMTALRDHHVTVVNPVETVLWNMDKEYLAGLEARGVPIPETRWIAPGSSIDLSGLLREAKWERAVLKPRVSATAYGTHLLTAGTVLDEAQLGALAKGGALLQAFMPEIQSGGEMSLVYLDGRFSHAVIKQPSSGDFRVQHEFGGTAAPATATGALRDFGARVLAAAPVPWTYARVDVVDTRNGPVLMELELIEPDLFLTFEPDGARFLGQALFRAGGRHD